MYTIFPKYMKNIQKDFKTKTLDYLEHLNIISFFIPKNFFE